MKTIISLIFSILVITSFNRCKSASELASGLVRLQVMENICVSNFSYQITELKSGSTDRNIEFKAILSNPSQEDGVGSVRLVMGVDASGLTLSSGVQSISANSVLPYFETPVNTIYPGNQINSYTSPVLVSLPYTEGATYKIEIRKFLPPNQDSDDSSCHNFKITKQF